MLQPLAIPNCSDHVVYRKWWYYNYICYYKCGCSYCCCIYYCNYSLFTCFIFICIMFSSCFYFKHRALLCNITFLMDIHREMLTFHKTWASQCASSGYLEPWYGAKKSVCDLLYMGGKCFRVISVIYDDIVLKAYTVLKYGDQMIQLHCFHSSIFCIEHRLFFFVCDNDHYNELLWANSNFSILWLLIYFSICFYSWKV